MIAKQKDINVPRQLIQRIELEMEQERQNQITDMQIQGSLMKKEEDVDGTYYMVEKSVLNPINQISTSILNGSEDLQQYQQSM